MCCDTCQQVEVAPGSAELHQELQQVTGDVWHLQVAALVCVCALAVEGSCSVAHLQLCIDPQGGIGLLQVLQHLWHGAAVRARVRNELRRQVEWREHPVSPLSVLSWAGQERF